MFVSVFVFVGEGKSYSRAQSEQTGLQIMRYRGLWVGLTACGTTTTMSPGQRTEITLHSSPLFTVNTGSRGRAEVIYSCTHWACAHQLYITELWVNPAHRSQRGRCHAEEYVIY